MHQQCKTGSMTLPEQRCMASTATAARMDNIRVIAAISHQYMSYIAAGSTALPSNKVSYVHAVSSVMFC